MVVETVVDQPQVNMRQELSSNIRNLLMFVMVFNGILVVSWVLFGVPELHVVHADAVIGQCFTVYIPNGLANLQEPFVLIDGHLELAKVVIEDTRAVVGTTLISGLARTLTSESQDVVVFESL